LPNWIDVLREIESEQQSGTRNPLDSVRRKFLRQLSEKTGRNTVAYYSAFLTKPNFVGTDINDDDKNGLMLCFHEVERDRGLDLILHTPGGSIGATQSIVHYLNEMFSGNIRAIVPQIAMSAGTMIACACKSVLMGKHSNLGPIDPQLGGLPVLAVKRQFERAFREIMADGRAAAAWSPILRQLGPSFLQECDWALDWAEQFVKDCLTNNMFFDRPNAAILAEEATQKLMDENSKGHDRHFHYQDCIGFGLSIQMIEDDPALQDAVLTVHHCYMHTLSNSNALKIIENHDGKALIKNQTASPQSLTIGLGFPPTS
jgi:hypothetical protein